MPPDLLLHPVFDKREVPTRVSYRKVVHPAPQNRVDPFDDPLHRLAGVPPEDLFELVQQRRALLPPRRLLWPPHSLTTQNAPKLKAQESKALPLPQVDDSAFLLVDLYAELRQFLP
jgi:hypothetical protein